MLRNVRAPPPTAGRASCKPPRDTGFLQRQSELLEEDEESAPAGIPHQRPNITLDGDDDDSSTSCDAVGTYSPRASAWQADPLALHSTGKLRPKWGFADHTSLPDSSPASPRISPRGRRAVVKEDVLLKQNSTWPRHWVKRPLVLYSDCSICYYEDIAGRLLGVERGKMTLTAASSSTCMSEDHRFSVSEGRSGRDLIWEFEASSQEQRAAWVDMISSHIHKSYEEFLPDSRAEACAETLETGTVSSHDSSVLQDFQYESRRCMDKKTSGVLLSKREWVAAKKQHADRPLSDSLREGILSAARFNRLLDKSVQDFDRPLSARSEISPKSHSAAKMKDCDMNTKAAR
jgi:hypothetical protein